MSTHATRRGAISTVAAALAAIASAGSLASASTTEVGPSLPLIDAHRVALAAFTAAVSRREADAVVSPLLSVANDALDDLMLTDTESPSAAAALLDYAIELGADECGHLSMELLRSVRAGLAAFT